MTYAVIRHDSLNPSPDDTTIVARAKTHRSAVRKANNLRDAEIRQYGWAPFYDVILTSLLRKTGWYSK